jgi:chromatin segregation and condensation protein Rec8/ScpA/Scc1 (kleisin family)
MPIQQQIICEEEVTLAQPLELSSEVEKVTRTETTNENEIIEGIKDGKKYFHDFVNPQNTNKKRAANMFYSLLKLAGNCKVKVIQEQIFGPIRLSLE